MAGLYHKLPTLATCGVNKSVGNNMHMSVCSWIIVTIHVYV